VQMNWMDSSQEKYKWVINIGRNVQHLCPKGNANENYNEIPSHPSQNAKKTNNRS
jgi:hypothetical protein